MYLEYVDITFLACCSSTIVISSVEVPPIGPKRK